ncbi:MAG: CPBP family intramembrane metalloprotease [Calditrichaeota bacterium]|nr:CPBP family intramembrane metalloprotease [Calditrichota bacterium]
MNHQHGKEVRVFWALLSISLLVSIVFAASRQVCSGGWLASLGIYILLLAALFGHSVTRWVETWQARFQGKAARGALPVLGLYVIYAIYAALAGQLTGAAALKGFLYLALPYGVLLLDRSDGQRLNLWNALVILLIWLPIEFSLIPQISVPIVAGVDYFKLAAIVEGLYLFIVFKPVEGFGFNFLWTKEDLKKVATYFALFLVFFAIPIGMPFHFIRQTPHLKPWYEWIVQYMAIFLFTGIPEEILFRGMIHNFLQKTIRGKNGLWIALAISSIIFGLAHGNNHNAPFVDIHLGFLGVWHLPWVYVILASIAGWYYGLTYIRTGKVTAGALVHAFVDTWWSIFFGG